MRSSWGNPTKWSNWMALKSDGQPDSSDYTDLSMFERVGVIGDSYCSGSIYYNGGSSQVTNYNLSWPSNLARQHGIDRNRYSVGGWGTYNFLFVDNENWREYGSYKLEQDFADPDKRCGLYIISFGINDSNPSRTFGDKSGGPDYLGSSDDVDDNDYTNNANSFWGNMSRIISMIKSGSPESRIVITTLGRFGSTRYDTYSAEIPAIAAYNGVPYITLTDDGFFNSDYYTHVLGGHPTAQLYAGMAKAISRLIQKCMVDNWEYFNEYRGV